MHNCFVSEFKGDVVSIVPVCQKDFKNWLEGQSDRDKNLVRVNKFLGKSNTFCLLVNEDGTLKKVILGVADKQDFLSFGILPKALPEGCYEIVASDFTEGQLERAAIGWAMGSYQFKKYKEKKDYSAVLVCREKNRFESVSRAISSIFLIRDLINTPAEDMYPECLGEVALDLSKEFGAKLKIVEGKELLKEFPSVHAVGRASEKQPILIDLRYGEPSAPKVVLVGKGVCFDSGGIQLKPSARLDLMKGDMAGAAHALALARMIMAAKLPINLRVIVPAVENLISGGALKPGDVIKTRKGISLEILNTDAEGRLILADALALASEDKPELIFDFATLTGAARVALGPDISALFSNDDKLAQDIIDFMSQEKEPVWRMPLYQPYLEFVKGEIADFNNIPAAEGIGAGAITAALILQQFVDPKIKWAHLDIGAYNATTKPGRPEGGEFSCLLGLFKYIESVLS